MNGSRGNNNSSTSKESLQNKRLKEIRQSYEYHKQTQQQRDDDMKQAGEELLERMRRNGASEATIAMYARDFAIADAAVADAPDEPKIVRETFNYSNNITISSEGSRHWRLATVHDVRSIVYMDMWPYKFGQFKDTGYASDEDYPDEKHTTAIVDYFSGGQDRPWAAGDMFNDLLIVPEEVLLGVSNESPPGRFFSGKTSSINTKPNDWNPAPEGKVWFQHPFLKNPNGMYFNDCQYYCVKKLIEFPGISKEIVMKGWIENGLLAYWCPVLQRFISEGERYRLEHWFHNGNGSAQERYYYDQNEMLDMHGGLEKLPTKTSSCQDDDDDDDRVCFLGVMKAEEVIAKRRKTAEANGEIVDIDKWDQKMPAKKQRTK